VNYNNSVDHTYRYGSTQGGRREPHHGVEFPNAQGTPVLAVADGVVVFAGDDKATALAWMPAYYGKVVVIEHHLAGMEGSVFSLYGHQFKINVQQGQRVRAGDEIGQVGATGRAIGSHLHFEVRVGNNNYRSNRNPELWLTPLAGTGVLAGRIQDGSGASVSGMINIQRFKDGVLNTLSVGTAETYVTNEAQPVRGDDDFEESFVVGELPAGDYRLTLIYNDKIYEQVIKIEPGRLTFVKFFVK
jgi:murein DD-endopeptidase MepM/ murein hydrolase activator NlpD